MFTQARLKLTLIYLLFITLTSGVFSTLIYLNTSHQIEGFIQFQNERVLRFQEFSQDDTRPRGPQNQPPLIPTQELIDQKHLLLSSLIILNLGIIVVSGAGAYYLAGRTLKPIQTMLNQQNQFIADSSHELRTPIATLKAEVESYLMEKRLTHKQARQILNSNLQELDSLHNLVNNLLQIAKLENNNQDFQLKKHSIKKILLQSIKKITPLAKERNITIKHKITDRSVLADAPSLSELFIILLDNAIKYSPKNSTTNIATRISSNTLSITIKDQGIGISPDELKNIFHRFYRADKSRSTTDGHGLGLSIAQKIALKHNASLTAHSNGKKGSIFTLKLPLQS